VFSIKLPPAVSNFSFKDKWVSPQSYITTFIAKGTLKQEQQEKEIIIIILITDNQMTSFLDDRILTRKLLNNEI